MACMATLTVSLASSLQRSRFMGVILGPFRSEYEYKIEYEYDFQNNLNKSGPLNFRFFPVVFQ